MKNEGYSENTLTIKGKEIPVKQLYLRHEEIRFYQENPRIYSFVFAGEDELSQDDIERRLTQIDHVKQLVQSIRANGGLLDPVIVREGDNVVIEGNSRLAAYRILSRKNPIKWAKIKCTLLPPNIGEDYIFALLGEYHIIGRLDWAPFEQAGYLWRRYHKHSIPPERMSREMGLGVKKINHLISVYTFMLKYEEANVQRWSHYDEYLKSTKIKRAREYNPELDDVIVKKIKSGDIPKASDVRDKVSKIAAAKGDTLKRFINTDMSLEDCYELAIHRGVTNVIYNRLRKFRENITDPELKKELLKMPNVQKNKCKYEIKKIKQAIDKIHDRLVG